MELAEAILAFEVVASVALMGVVAWRIFGRKPPPPPDDPPHHHRSVVIAPLRR